MSPLQEGDLFVVNRGNESYKVEAKEVGEFGDGVTRIIAGDNVTISPTGGTGEVRINSSGGGGGTSPTPNLAQVCAQGSNTPTSMGIDGNLNVGGEVLGVDGRISCQERLDCAATIYGQALEISGTATLGRVNGVLQINGPSGTYLATNGAIYSPHTYNVSEGGDVTRSVLVSGSDGLFRAQGAATREEIESAEPLDTTTFPELLEDATVVSYEGGNVGVLPGPLHARRPGFLTHSENEVDHLTLVPYLVGVCKEQEQCITELKATCAALNLIATRLDARITVLEQAE